MKNLLSKLKEFRDKRDWKKFHTPENLAKSIVIEAAELLENYQWDNSLVDLENVKEEVADIFAYLLLLCDAENIDLYGEIEKKIKKNNEKYPVDKAYGIAKKYTDL